MHGCLSVRLSVRLFRFPSLALALLLSLSLPLLRSLALALSLAPHLGGVHTQEEAPGASSAAQAAGGPVGGDATLRREMSQLRRNEHEAQMQAELARKDAEIERARMEAEMEVERARMTAEAEKLKLQLEIERLRNQSTTAGASACCSVS